MRIGVGSTNKVKVNAVRETVADYEMFRDVEVVSVETSSGVSDQPLSLQETITGAKNRARAAYAGNEYGVGLESGLFDVPETKTGMMDTCVCAIYDGKEFHIGLSSCFESPIKITEMVKQGTHDITQAFNEHKLSDDPKLGAAEGAIGLLTKGKVNRLAYTKQAIVMALIHLENPHLYTK